MRRVTAILATLAALVAAPSASAATFYVAEGATDTDLSCPEANPCTLDTAISSANSSPLTLDRLVVLGPYERTDTEGTVFLNNSPIDLVGSGTDLDGTNIVMNDSSVAINLGAGSSISNLHAAGKVVVVRARLGSRIESASVNRFTFGTAITVEEGIAPTPANAVIRDSLVVAPFEETSIGIAAFGNDTHSTEVLDSTIRAGNGIRYTGVPGGPAAIVARSSIEAILFGFHPMEGDAELSSSSIRMVGPNARAINGVVGPGLEVRIVLRQVTLDGSATVGGSSGVVVQPVSPPGSQAEAEVHGSIVRGFASDISSVSEANLTVGRSNFHTIFPSETGGEFNDLGGNIDADPRFVDAQAGDYRLRFDSPSIDAAGTDPPAGSESATDLAGLPRILDGNGDGSAVRDMGAFEYRGVPSASLAGAPNPVPTGQPVAFEATATVPQGGSIARYEWDLDGDGLFETDTGATPSASRAYASPGTLTVRVRAIADDGAPGEASLALTVLDDIVPGLADALLRFRVFRVGPGPNPSQRADVAQRRRPPTGTEFRYTLSEPATVRFAIQRRKRGRRVGGRCRKPTPRRRNRPRCARWVRRGVFTRSGVAGPNQVPWSGRIGSRALKPGRYRAVLRAIDAAGNRSAPVRLRFRIVR